MNNRIESPAPASALPAVLGFCLFFLVFFACPACLATEAMDKYQIGAELLSKGSAESALFFFDKSIKLNPNYYPAYVKRGDALKKLGKTSWAIEDYKYALKLNPRCSEAKARLGGLSPKRKARKKPKSGGSNASSAVASKSAPNDRGLSGMSRKISTGKTSAPPTSD
ncbi:tetratricopeptide repeat protein [bacterium]|nr:tetratricopeptide repeat protein [bacterium]